MRQDQLDGLVTFVHVAEHCSFTLASHQMGVSPSAVSQVVRSLEGRLGVVLFKRTTRSVKLTEVGERFINRVKPLIVELAQAAEEIAYSTVEPSGVLRLVATTPAYLTVLRPAMGRFLQRYPAIDMEIILCESRVDLVREGFDAGIGLDWQVDRDLVAVGVGPERCMLALASPDYLARRGIPAHPNDLLKHDCIGYRQVGSGVVERWTFDNGQGSLHLSIKSRLVYSDPAAQLQAALDGLGIAYLSSGHTDSLQQEGRLVRVLEGWERAVSPYMLYFPDRRSITSRLRLFIDHLRGAEVEGLGRAAPESLSTRS